MLRTIRNIAISVLVLLIIFIGTGVAYVLIAGGDVNDTNNNQAPAPKAENNAIPKPNKPSPNAPVGVSIQSLMSPVAPGANSSVSIKTLPGASCTVAVSYNNVPSKDSGLAPKAADDYGTATWSWTVDKTAPAGKWPVKITCTYNKKSGMVIGDLVVETK